VKLYMEIKRENRHKFCMKRCLQINNHTHDDDAKLGMFNSAYYA